MIDTQHDLPLIFVTGGIASCILLLLALGWAGYHEADREGRKIERLRIICADHGGVLVEYAGSSALCENRNRHILFDAGALRQSWDYGETSRKYGAMEGPKRVEEVKQATDVDLLSEEVE